MNKTILVVDDEPDIQRILGAYLQNIDDVTMVSTLSGEDAVDTYRELSSHGETPVMVVIDLNLSGSNDDQDIVEAHRRGDDEVMDGVRTAEAIRAFDTDALIWGYTAWEDTTWSDRLRQAGAQKVVSRLVPFKTFAEQVAAVLHDKQVK